MEKTDTPLEIDETRCLEIETREDSCYSQILSEADIKHNVKVNILLDSIFITGAADLALAAGPLYVFLKASDTLIGLMGSLTIMSLIGSFLSPFITRRFVYKKWYLFVSHVPYIGAWGMIGIALVLSKQLGLSNSWLLSFVFIMNAANMFFAGFVTLPHSEYIAACIPMKYRARYTGYSTSIGSIGSIVSSAVAGLILLHFAKPTAFGYLYMFTWIVCTGGYAVALLGRERPTPVEKSPLPWSKNMLKAFWDDKKYVRLLVFNALFFTLIMPVFTFVPIYGYRRLHMIPATAATIAIVQMVVRIAIGPPIGHYTDKIGPKRVLPYWMFVAVLALVAPLLLRNSYGVYLSSALIATCFSGVFASFLALQSGLPSPENRAGHFTIAIFLRNAGDAVGMVLAGALCDLLGYTTVFGVSAIVALALFFVARRLLSTLSGDYRDYA
ncbi:MAG: MFS transporter [Candidatus Marsarchaeota archaeon]|nr:MFS transporter [Candidatus Marsarchaeota archaeon]